MNISSNDIDRIFVEELDSSTYSNFKEVYKDLLYTKLGVLRNYRPQIQIIQATMLYQDMQNKLSFDPDLVDINLPRKLALIQSNVTSQPICHCGSLIKYTNSSNGLYNVGCCMKCIASSAQSQNATKHTSLERYGVENAAQCKEIRDKTKQTNLERYGTEYSFQNKKIQDKIKQTNLERYGFEYPIQRNEIQEKIKQTNLERYGVENALQSKQIQEKIKQTNLERYGFENPSKNKEIQDKTKQTNLERYGVECSMQYKEVRDKAKQTNLERYGVAHTFQCKEVQEKIKQTNVERYGVENPSQSKDLQTKVRATYLENHIDSIWDNILRNTHCIPLFTKEEYVGCNYNISYKWECTNCTQQYMSYYYSGVKACPICTKSRSLGEIELYNYIQSLIPDIEVLHSDYTILGFKELDIYIPTLKLAFEYNGDYWHSLKEDGYHENKTEGCLTNGIVLHHIWESAWKNNQQETKEFIAQHLQNAKK